MLWVPSVPRTHAHSCDRDVFPAQWLREPASYGALQSGSKFENVSNQPPGACQPQAGKKSEKSRKE